MKAQLLKLILLFLITCGGTSVKSQGFLPFTLDNYGGASAMQYNPAVIADSRYKFDMEIFGFSNRIENNMATFNRSLIFNPSNLTDFNSLMSQVNPIINGKTKNVMLDLNARAMSFMISLNEKSSIGFSAGARAVFNFNRLPESAALLVLNSNNVDSLFRKHLYEDMSQQAASWGEFGITYAREILNKDHHYLKAGVTAKLLQGIGAIYLYEKKIEYNLENPDTATKIFADIRFGLTGNPDDLTKLQFSSKPSVGWDFGIIYEWRPHVQDFKYDMDGKTNLWRRDKNKYKLRLAASLVDLGGINFEKQFNSGNFIIDTNILDLALLHAGSLTDLADSINNIFGTESLNNIFKMKLPTTLNFNIDYNIWKGLYANLSASIAFNQGTKYIEKVHYYNNYAFTPRYEHKWWGVSIPIRYTQFGQLKMGLGLRLGPIWLGSTDIGGILGIKNDISGSDLHLAVKLPIMYSRPKDKDGDKVSNKMDKCPKIPGSWEHMGCPDTDGDGIVDSKDDCPKVAGLPKFNGCPDTDGDDIIDSLDQCPEVAGLKEFQGCPDTDGDGIIDKLDTCVNIAGLAKFNGCPDTDKDDIEDRLDDCPEVAGLAKFQGCPDTDSDGIRDVDDLCPTIAGLDSLQGCPYVDTDGDSIQDKYDLCPKIPGLRENHGCPITDTDMDSVPDNEDLCPMTPGPVSNNGCPIIKKEVQEILDTAFANLEFETGKSIIIPSSYVSLDKVAELLKNNPSFNLLIQGHTDNVGREAANMSLSQNRALAVKNYLISRTISKERIKAEWFGETKPIADNNTKEGRQKNRRVEMSIIFD